MQQPYCPCRVGGSMHFANLTRVLSGVVFVLCLGIALAILTLGFLPLSMGIGLAAIAVREILSSGPNESAIKIMRLLSPPRLDRLRARQFVSRLQAQLPSRAFRSVVVPAARR